MRNDLLRKGPGEHGVPYLINDTALQVQKDRLFKANGYSGLASDHISLSRSVRDLRHTKCRRRKYLERLPTASIVIPFYNEHLSTLLRTVTSLKSRAPASLIREIILVNDGSTKDDLQRTLLDPLVAEMFTDGVVRVLHIASRSGLIAARLVGAANASGDVLVFIDAHCEASYNWLPPLLEPIALDNRTCVCPFIDVIDAHTFEIRAQDEGKRGAFDWQFFYKRLDVTTFDREHMPDPFPSPVMAGGLFAISREFFWHIGGYDPGIKIWGGEQYEISFKIWMCGGRMLDAPCSRISHIYRKLSVFSNPLPGVNFVARNHRRVADVWMDEYAQYVYRRQPGWLSVDVGDISSRVRLREKLQCRTFKWFLDNVAFDLLRMYPAVEPDDIAYGAIRAAATDADLCVDAHNRREAEQVLLRTCTYHGARANNDVIQEQKFRFTWRREVRTGLTAANMCWDMPGAGKRAPLLLWSCHQQKGNQLWSYNHKHKWLVHAVTARCLDYDTTSLLLYGTTCDPLSRTQQWTLEHLNTTAAL